MFPNPYRFRDPWGFAKPMGNPWETRTPERGCGFPRVGVRVAPEKPQGSPPHSLAVALAPHRRRPQLQPQQVNKSNNNEITVGI